MARTTTLLLVWAALLVLASASAPAAPALHLRGGGVLSSLGEKLGWKRETVSLFRELIKQHSSKRGSAGRINVNLPSAVTSPIVVVD